MWMPNGLLNEDISSTFDQLTWWKFSRKSGNDWFYTELDANGDGKLDENEFGQTFDTGNHTENRFKRTDGDKSGFLDKPEVSEFLPEPDKRRGRGRGLKRKKKKRKK